MILSFIIICKEQVILCYKNISTVIDCDIYVQYVLHIGAFDLALISLSVVQKHQAHLK